MLWSKVQIFEILKWSEQISSNCGVNLEQQVNYSSNFASFFIVIIHYSSVNFKLINFLLWIKGCYQSPNFNFKYSVKNFRNYLCHFPNHKSVLHFASLFSVMRDNSCKLFQLKFYLLSTKGVSQTTNLVNFFASSRKSEILHFDGFLLSKPYKDSAKKVLKSFFHDNEKRFKV